ncbi:CPBP family intramembrane glutamic endopeptidase [Urechidicola vernalis]|uniref:CPBP family intramembrane glutamic endopeptidase n=1 Tax=Urechidicola vernalis TaxID=3075600 RepID=A0ABU2Y1A3_9FLAO|nr:CPBP family intramembrane glutamic endopeptidase [Urechidicola sp. P050]MDT0551787.1 CPBP family intramembrane glutamic endopeptidase [Urechidicola sp. P050]
MKQQNNGSWRPIILFLSLLTILSAIPYIAIVNLYPSSLYIGALMWCPTFATFITLKLLNRNLKTLPWQWPNKRILLRAYGIPLLYVTVTYFLIWMLGLGSIVSKEEISIWATEIGIVGIGTLPPYISLLIAIVLLASVGVLKSMATVIGEEIGWRGFFVFELRKNLSFTGVSLFSGFIWALWHWPLIYYYGSNIVLEFTTFFIVIISMSFVMTYYTFKSKSLWPAVIFHTVSNVFIQKVFPPITNSVKEFEYWHGEYGIMFAIVTCTFGIYFLLKGIKEQL